MLINEIGRFGDNIEDMQPSDLKSAIDPKLHAGCVGIFWHVGDNKWLIMKAPLLDDANNSVEMGQDYDEEDNPDDIQIDYNHFHKDIWNEVVIPKYPEYKDFKFDHFSRGRIVFNVEPEEYAMYIPNAQEFTQDAILFLAREFKLPLGSYKVDRKIYKKKSDMSTLTLKKNEILPL